MRAPLAFALSLAAACGGTAVRAERSGPSPLVPPVTTGGERRPTADPILAGAPCGRGTRASGLTLADGPLEGRVAEVVGRLRSGASISTLCPADGLVAGDRFDFTIAARAGASVHVIGVSSDGEVIPLTGPAGTHLAAGETLVVPGDTNAFTIAGESGEENILFMVDASEHGDGAVRELASRIARGQVRADELRGLARGTVSVDARANRVDLGPDEGGVAILRYAVTRSDVRTRSINLDDDPLASGGSRSLALEGQGISALGLRKPGPSDPF